MIARFFTRLRRREGQSLIIVALSLVVLIAFLGFVVDAAHAFVDYRHLQNTADAASLAAAQDVGSTCADPSNPVCLESTINQYVSYNGGPPGGLVPCDAARTTNCYTWPYGDGTQVLVLLRSCTSTFFGGIVGVPQICENVRSVSRAGPETAGVTIPGQTTPGVTVPGQTTPGQTIPGVTTPGQTTPGQTIPGVTTPGQTIQGSTTPGVTTPGSTVYSTGTVTTCTNCVGGTPRAIFANNTTCGGTTNGMANGITINSNPGTSIDAIESNGAITLPNSNKGTVTAAYLPNGTSGCISDNSSAGGVQSVNPLAAQSWPVGNAIFTRAAVCAGHDDTSGNPVKLNNPANGIYCSTTSIEVTAISGKDPVLTLVAPKIIIDSNLNNFTLHGYYSNDGYALSIWQTTNQGTDSTSGPTFTFNSNKAGVADVMWIQNGNLDYEGNSGVTGFYEAQNINVGGLNGNSYVMHGAGPPIGGGPGVTTVTNTVSTSLGTTSPGNTTPGQTSPGVTNPGSTGAGTTNAGSTSPGSTSPSSTTPGVTQGGSTGAATTQTVTTGTTIGLAQ